MIYSPDSATVIVALVILVPVLGVVAWAFFRFTPFPADRRKVLRFNLWSLAVALLFAVAWSVRTYLVMTPGVDSGWWPVISVPGLIIVPLVLALAAILRNFVLYR